MARVRIEIEYDDAQEDDSEQWSAFGTTSDKKGPSLMIERDGAELLSLAWFRLPLWVSSPMALAMAVLREASRHAEDEMREREREEDEQG